MRHHSAKRRARQRHADVVAGIQQRHPDQAANDPRTDHPRRIAWADQRTRHQTTKDEPEDRQHDAEQSIAEEARDSAAHNQGNGCRNLIRRWHHYSSRRPSIALVIVTSSAYSRSDPTGMPMAMRVTRTPSGLSRRARYSAVASPSTVGLVARITSSTPPVPTRVSSPLIFRSAGPTPCSGESAPINT